LVILRLGFLRGISVFIKLSSDERIEAGFDDVHVSPRMVYVDGNRPELADAFTRKTFTAMIEGVREPVIAASLIQPQRFDEGVRALYRAAEPDGVFCYTFFKAVPRRI
jgi:hypothetical protein